MAARLVWLKWRLFINGLRHDRQRAIGLPLLIIVIVGLGWWAASSYISTAAALPQPSAGEFSLWVVTLGWLIWVTLPVLLFPLDEPLDPARFGVLPMSRSRLMGGLAASGLVTVSMLVPIIFLVANLVVFSSPGAAAFGIVASVLLLILLVIGGQAFTLLVSLGLRNRRGRDVAFVMVAAIGLSGFVLYQLITRTIDQLGLAGAVETYSLSPLAWLIPPATAQWSLVAAHDGSYGTALLYLVAAAGWVLILAVGWHALLDRLITTPGNASLPIRETRRALARRSVPTSMASVVSRKEVRFYVRDPRMRMVWTGGAVFLGIMAASVLVGSTQLDLFRRLPWLTLAGPVVVLFIGLPITLNQFGWERNAASYLFALPAPSRAILIGKNRASGAGLLLEAGVMSLVLAAVSGGWRWLPLALPVAITLILCQLAVGNVVSVLTPLRLPPMGTDLFAQATEQGCLAILSQAASFFLIGLIAIPAGVAFLLAVAGVLNPIAASIGSVLWAASIYALGLWGATSLLTKRVPELVQAVETE